MDKEKPSFYAIIPANVRYDKTLKPNAKLLYGEITALCSNTGECWASNAYFAELYGVSLKQVSLWINSLKNGGYLEVRISKELGNKRFIAIHQKVNTSEPKGVDPIHQKVKHSNTDIITNSITTNKYKFDEEKFEEFWSAYAKKRGKPKSIEIWKRKKINTELADKIIEAAKIQSKSVEVKFRKDPERWIRNECWNDDVIIIESSQGSEPAEKSELQVKLERWLSGFDNINPETMAAAMIRKFGEEVTKRTIKDPNCISSYKFYELAAHYEKQMARTR